MKETLTFKHSETQLKILGFDSVPPFATNLVKLYGLAAINFAKLEQQLDLLLLNIHREEFNLGNFRPAPNVSFEGKRDIFEMWFVKDARLSHLHEKGKRLYASLGKAAEDRHLLFHSSVQELVEGPPPSLRIIKLRINYKARTFTLHPVNVDENQLERTASGFSALTKGMAHLCQATMNDEFLQSLLTSKRNA